MRGYFKKLSLSRTCRRHVRLVCVLAAVLMTGWQAVLAGAAPQITWTKPAKIFVGMGDFEIRIHGSGFVPAGSPYQTLPQVEKVFMRAGSQGSFVEAPLVIPSAWGWGESEFTALCPKGLTPSPGVLQIKVTVNGVPSNIFEVPVVFAPPLAAPHITSVSPAETKLGSSDYYFILKVSGTGIDSNTWPRFQGQGNIPAVQSMLEGFVQFSVPKSFRDKPGHYTIQLVNKQGSSNIAYWDLVKDPGPSSPAPSAPTGLVATLVGPTLVRLSWQCSASGLTGFSVERKKTADTGPYGLIKVVGKSVTSYEDNSVSSNERYTYRVRAWIGGKPSASSNEVEILTGQKQRLIRQKIK